MKRITTLLLIWLSVFQLPNAVGQDVNKGGNTTDEEDTSSVHEEKDAEQAKCKKTQAVFPMAIGLEAGVSIAYLRIQGKSNTPVPGWRIGSFIYIPLAEKLCLQPGLFYTTGGGGYTYVTAHVGTYNSYTGYTTTDAETYIRTIELPVNIGFRYGHRRHAYNSFIGIGPYIGYTIGAESANENLKIGADIKRFDYGIGLNTSQEWKCGLFLRGRVQAGLVDLLPSNLSSAHSFSYGFQFGYLFGKKHTHVIRHHADDTYLYNRM